AGAGVRSAAHDGVDDARAAQAVGRARSARANLDGPALDRRRNLERRVPRRAPSGGAADQAPGQARSLRRDAGLSGAVVGAHLVALGARQVVASQGGGLLPRADADVRELAVAETRLVLGRRAVGAGWSVPAPGASGRASADRVRRLLLRAHRVERLPLLPGGRRSPTRCGTAGRGGPRAAPRQYLGGAGALADPPPEPRTV